MFVSSDSICTQHARMGTNKPNLIHQQTFLPPGHAVKNPSPQFQPSLDKSSVVFLFSPSPVTDVASEFSSVFKSHSKLTVASGPLKEPLLSSPSTNQELKKLMATKVGAHGARAGRKELFSHSWRVWALLP